MRIPFLMNLNKLTQADVDLAMQNQGACLYSAPCILGTLLPVKLVKEMQNTQSTTRARKMIDSSPIEDLIRDGWITFPDVAQEQLAVQMQAAFDGLVVYDSQLSYDTLKELLLKNFNLSIDKTG